MKKRAALGAATAVGILLAMRPAAAQRAKPKPTPFVAEKPAEPAEPKLPDLLAAAPNGLTSEQAGLRALNASPTAHAAENVEAAAAARVDQASAAYYPRIGLVARYTRLSSFLPPSEVNGFEVLTDVPPGTANPTPTVSADTRFPLILNQYLLQATLLVPISDYFWKIGQTYTAATHQEAAAHWDVVGARAKAYSDARSQYFVWLRTRGATTVAQEALNVAKNHVKDTELMFNNGSVSKADELRAQSSLAQAELAVERSKNALSIVEEQLRVAIQSAPEEKLEPGEALDVEAATAEPNRDALIAEAMAKRPELKSLDENASALRRAANAAKASEYPSLSAFGDVTYANPNPRRFPQEDLWFPTWSLGAQITWTPNDFLTSRGSARELEARAAAAESQRVAVRNGIQLEVGAALTALLESRAALQATNRQLESAKENYRVARELYVNNRATSTQLIDAETLLAQSRFDSLNARVEVRLAQIRLSYATGEAAEKVASTR